MASTSSPPQQPSVAVVTTQGCPYCRQAKADLTAAGIPYTEILITNQLDILSEIKKTTGQSTVPQVSYTKRSLKNRIRIKIEH
jgi:glutaredoxin